jgi:hypothetical protein
MFDRPPERIWPIALQQIEDTVAMHLGSGRVPGNKQDKCFSRQVSMYLAKHVGGWSTPQIGRFYNGRHHTTVLHAIGKIERLRKQDASVDALLEVLSGDLRPAATGNSPSLPFQWSDSLLDALAERVLRRLPCNEIIPRNANGLAILFSRHSFLNAFFKRRLFVCQTYFFRSLLG